MEHVTAKNKPVEAVETGRNHIIACYHDHPTSTEHIKVTESALFFSFLAEIANKLLTELWYVKRLAPSLNLIFGSIGTPAAAHPTLERLLRYEDSPR